MTEKQMIIDSGQKWLDAFDSKVLYVSRETVELVLKVLKEEPQIVRCKDCKYYQPDEYDPGKGDCMGPCDNMVKVSDDWFCADGEKSHD